MNKQQKASSIIYNAYQMFTTGLNSDDAEAFPMYSYNRPAYNFWAGVIDLMLKEGKTEKEIKDWLMSKDPRWLLDEYEEDIRKLGYDIMSKHVK